ncbi:serine/threonine protein kinase [Flindersiella endophytica]
MTTAMSTTPEPALVHRGTGPVATVYMTVPPAGGRAAAVKVYPAGLDRATATELLEEQRTLAALRNVSSTLLIDRLEELPDGRAAIWMELCAQSLAELVEVGGPLALPDVLGLGETLATVLSDAHNVGIVHGGVTPANVLFRPAGQPVLADFGLCLRHRFPRQPEAAAAYIAPEVLRGTEPAAAADLYGLGAVLHFALTGSSPFPSRPGEPAGEVLLRALGEPPPTVTGQDLPPALPALVTALLAKDPAARPGSATQVVEVLRELAAAFGEPLSPSSVEDAGPDFDDFRDELPAARASVSGIPDFPPVGGPPVEVAAPSPGMAAPPASVGPVGPQHAPVAPGPPVPNPGQPKPAGTKPGRSWQLPSIAIAAAAVLAVVIVLVGALGGVGGGNDDKAEPNASKPAVATQPTATTPSDRDSSPTRPAKPSSTPVPNARIEINQLSDRGTTVRLAWRSSKPLSYAVIIAEQGKKDTSTKFRGTATTYTAEVDPDLKYCFLIQGTDGTNTWESNPRAIRGAVCRND